MSLGHKEIKVLCPPEVDVACHNSINSSTISGPEHIVIQFVEDLKKKDIFARAVNVANIAYHSRYIQPAAPRLLRYLKQLITDPKPRSSKWISSSVPESEWDTPLAKYSSPEYHTNNLLKEVLFEESTTRIPNNAIVIEIAPHGLLQAILRRSFGSECIHIPLTLRGHPNSAEFLLTAVGNDASAQQGTSDEPATSQQQMAGDYQPHTSTLPGSECQQGISDEPAPYQQENISNVPAGDYQPRTSTLPVSECQQGTSNEPALYQHEPGFDSCRQFIKSSMARANCFGPKVAILAMPWRLCRAATIRCITGEHCQHLETVFPHGRKKGGKNDLMMKSLLSNHFIDVYIGASAQRRRV
uniref:(California timema) hypothetical protein n=1 Tax=Timema californicum TaxID=61474 RepID=A0A7R9PAU6_TIMCA|nr:unnamed protein product [Timema californicum]